jgi:hypothetical protein
LAGPAPAWQFGRPLRRNKIPYAACRARCANIFSPDMYGPKPLLYFSGESLHREFQGLTMEKKYVANLLVRYNGDVVFEVVIEKKISSSLGTLQF